MKCICGYELGDPKPSTIARCPECGRNVYMDEPLDYKVIDDRRMWLCLLSAACILTLTLILVVAWLIHYVYRTIDL